jgi:ufm1-conjugating enzyme 1
MSEAAAEKPPVEVIKRLSKLPTMKIKAGPRDGDLWLQRLEEEYKCLIVFVELQKENSSDWFKIESNEEGTRWFGTCWHVYNHVKYEFDVEFDIPATYPTSAPEIELPQLDGKTAKMYRGGKICLTDHFFPLWAKNVPKFGIVHALALGLAPWLNAEIPFLVEEGTLAPPKASS